MVDVPRHRRSCGEGKNQGRAEDFEFHHVFLPSDAGCKYNDINTLTASGLDGTLSKLFLNRWRAMADEHGHYCFAAVMDCPAYAKTTLVPVLARSSSSRRARA
jgi:hypothetical protein